MLSSSTIMPDFSKNINYIQLHGWHLVSASEILVCTAISFGACTDISEVLGLVFDSLKLALSSWTIISKTASIQKPGPLRTGTVPDFTN